MDIGHMIGANNWPGDASGWKGGVAQASIPVTNLSPHVDGGLQGATGSAVAPASAVKTLHVATGIVVLAMVLLWLMGTLVFKSARL